MTASDLRISINSTLKALGGLATIYDVRIALQRLVEAKVARDVGALFSGMSGTELLMALEVVNAEVDAKLEESRSMTPPPPAAPVTARSSTLPVPKKRKG